MFKNILAGLGIDSAKVDLQLEQDHIELGGIVKGKVIFKGGAVDQQLDELSISLVINSEYKHDDSKRPVSQKVAEIKVCDSMLIKAESPEQIIPVEFNLPYNIPISYGKTTYHFETSLEISNAIDPTDEDYIKVLPNRHTKILLDAVSRLGFRKKTRSGEYNGRYQLFEYKPTSFMYGKLDEIELIFEAHENRINIMMQIDKKARGLFGGLMDELDLDEKYVSFHLNYDEMNNVEQVAEKLKDIISNEYQKI
ncbi:MAG: sporulation protein [Firmicutes bacterium]|nr:sporulation protein [Bacillota bacterium]